MPKTIPELKSEKEQLFSDLDAYIETDNLQSDEAKDILKRIACVDEEIKQLANVKKAKPEIDTRQKKKKLILICASFLMLALFVVLTIVLNTTAVFKGTYHSEKEKIVFYDNTYTYSYKDGSHLSFGFYSKYGDEVGLFRNEDDVAWFKRKNVFTLETRYGEKFKCDGAICLQVFYCAGMLVFVSVLIVQIPKYRKLKNN